MIEPEKPYTTKPHHYEIGDRVSCRETGLAGVVEDWTIARNGNGRPSIAKARKYAVRMADGRLLHFLRRGLLPLAPLADGSGGGS
jgi:hypothetical protein